jgi:hypothetical protein
MDNVHNCDNNINIPSSQTYTSHIHLSSFGLWVNIDRWDPKWKTLYVSIFTNTLYKLISPITRWFVLCWLYKPCWYCSWCSDTKTSAVYWAQLSRLHLKSETESSLQNVVFQMQGRTADNIPNCDSYKRRIHRAMNLHANTVYTKCK